MAEVFASVIKAEKKSEARKVLPIRRIRGRFDAAVTNADNSRHWANADGLSADAAASASVRETLRRRARYEVANNSYASGIVETLANDTVGTGPRLQMLTDNPEINSLVEAEFERWADEIGLADILRTMRMARVQDGESFAIMVNNPVVDHPVKLDLRLVEADMVTNPQMSVTDDDEVDGIKLDEWGNPKLYYVLKNHPGSGVVSLGNEYTSIHADHMIHVFKQRRPGQHRGIPEITPALSLFAQLRRYTLAVLAAAETAADFAAVLYTDAPADGEAQSLDPMDTVDLEKRMATVLPEGWQLGQIKAEQPTTTYAEFKKEILNEIARCLNIPFNIAAGNSSGYNYSSGRLDHQTYYKSINVDQAFIARKVLDRILGAWLWDFAETLTGNIGVAVRKVVFKSSPEHQWFWDGNEHVDPAKEANAQETRLRNYTTTLAQEYSRQGKDWEAELRQRAREKNLMKELGLTESEVIPNRSPDNDREE